MATPASIPPLPVPPMQRDSDANQRRDGCGGSDGVDADHTFFDTPFLLYITHISVFGPTDGAARILP